MALIFLGKTICPLCGETIQEGQATVATPHFIEARDHPLWAYSDAGLHSACFLAWEHRALFVSEFNRLMSPTVRGNGTCLQMQEDGTISSLPAATDIDWTEVSREAYELERRHGRHAHAHAANLADSAGRENDDVASAFWRAVSSTLAPR